MTYFDPLPFSQTPEGKRIASLTEAVRVLTEKLELAAEYLPDRAIDCHGDKCRYAWCRACNDDDYVDIAMDEARELHASIAAALTTAKELTNG